MASVYGKSQFSCLQYQIGYGKPTEGNAQLSINLLPQVATRDSAVPSKGPNTSRRGSRAADSADNGQYQQRDQQTESTSRRSDSVLDNRRNRLTGSQGEKAVDIRQDEQQRDHEQQPGEGVQDDGVDHGLGDLRGRGAHLLAHADDHARRGRGVGGLEETHAKGPTGWPSGTRLEGGEDVVGTVVAVFGDNENADDDGENTGEGPENGCGLLFFITKTGYDQPNIKNHMGQETINLTSRMGSHLSPKAEIALQSRVSPKKMRKICQVSPGKIPSPLAVSNTSMHATRNRAVPKLTARVMVTFPTTYIHPQIQLATLRQRGGESINVW